MPYFSKYRQWFGCFLIAAITLPAHAALFEDSDARRAILDVRQRMDTLRQEQDNQVKQFQEGETQLRRSLLELQNQLELLRQEQAALRGQNEQLQRDVSELQRSQKDQTQIGAPNGALSVVVDGSEFAATAAEKQDFEAALATFRQGGFAAAKTAFSDFVLRYPTSGYLPSALFWLGNSQYAIRSYQEAIASFKQLLLNAPDHLKAPEAALSIANCQVELNDMVAARKTWNDLTKVYPKSEAATAAKERLSRLK